MEEYNLDEGAAEFETDTEILNMMDSIKYVQRDCEVAKGHCEREERKRKQAQSCLQVNVEGCYYVICQRN